MVHSPFGRNKSGKSYLVLDSPSSLRRRRSPSSSSSSTNSNGSPSIHQSTSSDEDDLESSLCVILEPDEEEVEEEEIHYDSSHHLGLTFTTSNDDDSQLQQQQQDDELAHRHSSLVNLHRHVQAATSIEDLQDLVWSVETASVSDAAGHTLLHTFGSNPHLCLCNLLSNSSSNNNRGSTTPSSRLSNNNDNTNKPSPLQNNHRQWSQSSCSTTNSNNNNHQAGSPTTTNNDNNNDALRAALDLWRAYPAAMITTDAHGCIPFEQPIADWVRSVYQFTIHKQQSQRSLSTRKSHNLLDSLFFPHSLRPYDAENPKVPSMVPRDRTFPSHLRLPPHVWFCLVALSAILDELLLTAGSKRATTRNNTNHRRNRITDDLYHLTHHDMMTAIVDSIAAIPDLVKTILFLQDDEKEPLLQLTLVRRVLVNQYSVGSWLNGMLQSPQKKPNNLALQYLHLVSDLLSSSSSSSSSKSTRQHHKQTIQSLYRALSILPDFVPSLLSLEENQIEEASTTKVVQVVLDQIISRPFAVTVVCCDALFLVVLIYGYRGAVNSILLGKSGGTVLRNIYFSNLGIFYYLIREIGKALSICMITRRARIYFVSFWNLIDLSTTLLALVSTLAIRAQFISEVRTICAITTGFMWLRVLSYLKGINMQLATFVLAILQITRDILWFCAILFIVVVLFSQMFFTLLLPDECAEKENRETQECSQGEWYLKVYSVLLGDFGLFDREDFVSALSLFLVVLYTFLVVLVLLNVLIAVASDSYEKCLIRSRNLFGRARVMMIAELVSFQNLLRRNVQTSPSSSTSGEQLYVSWWSSNASWAHGWSRASLAFFLMSGLVTLTWTAGEIIGYLAGPRHGKIILMSLGSVCVNVALFAAIIWFLSTGASEESHKNLRTDESSYHSNCFTKWYSLYFQKRVVRFLGSTVGDHSAEGSDQLWKGRLLFLRDEMARSSQDTKNACAAMVQSLQARMDAAGGDLRNEVASVEKGLEALSNEQRAVSEDLHQKLDAILVALQKRETNVKTGKR